MRARTLFTIGTWPRTALCLAVAGGLVVAQERPGPGLGIAPPQAPTPPFSNPSRPNPGLPPGTVPGGPAYAPGPYPYPPYYGPGYSRPPYGGTYPGAPYPGAYYPGAPFGGAPWPNPGRTVGPDGFLTPLRNPDFYGDPFAPQKLPPPGFQSPGFQPPGFQGPGYFPQGPVPPGFAAPGLVAPGFDPQEGVPPQAQPPEGSPQQPPEEDALPPGAHTLGTIRDRAGYAGPAGGPRMRDYSWIHIELPPPKVVKVHDIITVIVSENSEVTSDSRFERQRNAQLRAQLRQFIRLDDELRLRPAAKDSPTIDGQLRSQLQANGLSKTREGIRYRIAATVVDVLPNGTLILEARKTIRTNEDLWEYALVGKIRSEDVLANNTVLSENIADLGITKTERGKVADSTKRGWFLRIYDALLPF